jgi:hypothetical protein
MVDERASVGGQQGEDQIICRGGGVSGKEKRKWRDVPTAWWCRMMGSPGVVLGEVMWVREGGGGWGEGLVDGHTPFSLRSNLGDDY